MLIPKNQRIIGIIMNLDHRSKIDKYEVTKKIGRGRYSEVFNGNIIGNTNISTSKNKCV